MAYSSGLVLDDASILFLKHPSTAIGLWLTHFILLTSATPRNRAEAA